MTMMMVDDEPALDGGKTMGLKRVEKRRGGDRGNHVTADGGSLDGPAGGGGALRPS